MRRRRRYYQQRRYHNKILLAEFKFYNKTKKVLDNNVLKEMENRLLNGENKIYWTNDEFIKNGIGFKFTSIKKDEKTTDIYVSVLEFDNCKLSASDFNKCKWIYGKRLFLGYNVNTLQQEMIDHIVSNWSYNEENQSLLKKPLMSWEETVNYLIETKALARYEFDNNWDEYIKDMTLLFENKVFENYPNKTDTTNKPKKPVYDLSGRSFYGNVNIYHILDVLEKRINNKNYRIAFISVVHDYYLEVAIKVISDDQEDYVYIDSGRLFFQTNDNFYYLDDNVKEYGKDGLIINRDIFKAMKRNINEILPQGEKVISANIYRFYKDRAIKFDRDGDYLGENTKEGRIIIQYKKLLEEGKTIKLHDTIIDNNKIEVSGERFKIEFNDDFLNVVENFGNLKKLLKDNDIRYNFNDLYEKILRLSILRYVRMEYTKEHQYKRFEKVEFIVNDMPISVHKDGNRMKINNIFSRINDVYYILTKAICYDNVKEFNRYIKEVSYIGIEWKQMISNGIGLELSNPFYNIFRKTGDTSLEKMYLRFSLLWDSNKRQQVYLMLNDNKYLIRYKGRFKYYFNMPHRVITLSQLKKELAECVENLDDDVVIEIVENAVEEAKIVKKRGEELVANTISDINAKETEVVITGNKVKGYIFKGRRTGNEYFIEKVNLGVYRNDGGQWNRRCIVDDHRKQRIFEDKLANRLINIYNEPAYLENYLGD